MSGELEAAGAAVTAGLAAAAIDSHASGDADIHGACPNCGAELRGAFCSACGQPAHLHRTLGHMVEEFLHGILHFDTRAWRTLPLLVFRPGTLTREYTHGKRARYISPLAMFLLVVFSMFAVFAMAGGSSIGVGREVEIDAPGPGAVTDAATTRGPSDVADPTKGDIYAQIREAYESGDLKVNTGIEFLDKKIKHKLQNPELAFYKIQNAAYKFAFLLVPISLPFIWLLFFWKRGLTLFDHTVYILYSLSFVSLLFIAVSFLSAFPGALEFALPWLLLSVPVHAFFQMKGGYSLSWLSALWRTPVLMVFAALGLGFFLIAIILLGLTG